MTEKAGFITLEGIEGCGKSTHAALLADALEAVGLNVVRTREPGGTPFAEKIREMVLSGEPGTMSAKGELFLYLAARSDHLENHIRPALAAHSWVVCDRFSDATVAYQGFGRQLGAERVQSLATWAEEIKPDLTLLLDLPVEDGLARVKKRGDPNRMDREDAAFHERVRHGYLELAQSEPSRIVRIDSTAPIHEVHKAIVRAVEERLGTLIGKALKPAMEAAG